MQLSRFIEEREREVAVISSIQLEEHFATIDISQDAGHVCVKLQLGKAFRRNVRCCLGGDRTGIT